MSPDLTYIYLIISLTYETGFLGLFNIDKLVYELYGLTEEEIKLVGGQ